MHVSVSPLPLAVPAVQPPIKHEHLGLPPPRQTHTTSVISFSAETSTTPPIAAGAGLPRRRRCRTSLLKSWEMEIVVGDLMATELRLGLPGTTDDSQTQMMKVPSAPSTPRGKKRNTADAVEDAAAAEEASKRDAEAAPPAAKAPVVGWPPVRSYRKSCFQASSSKQISKATKEEAAPPSSTPSAAASTTGSFVKVSMDGAPYLRKVDLRMYKGYRELREALEAMFVSSNGGGANLSEFAVTYEDKDGDLMLVGDVPFEMFTSTCKKLRIMKRSEATGLGSARQ